MDRQRAKGRIAGIVSFALIVSTVCMCSGIKKKSNMLLSDEIRINESESSATRECRVSKSVSEEMRAVWVPFMTLDIKSNPVEERFKAKFREIVSGARNCGMNTLVVHVRSHSDAMYPSKIFPWSHVLTGIRGKDPGFDPLKFMVDAAHEAGMEFHAWVNPLRIRVNGTPASVEGLNPYAGQSGSGKSDGIKNLTFSVGNNIYCNPAVPEVRDIISAGVREIAENYNVDAIHFDDYFYPLEGMSENDDLYDRYTESCKGKCTPLDLKDWRTENINSLIAQVYKDIKSIEGKDIKFGISPSGNVCNDYKMGADVKKWGSTKGYADYLCPQIYTNSENPVLPFEKAADEWNGIVNRDFVKLYYGLGVYKAGSDADEGTWRGSNDIIMRQIEYCRKKGCDGFMLYSWDYMSNPNTSGEVENVIRMFRQLQ